MILSKKLRRIVPRQRRTIIIASVALVVLLVAIYGFWSMNTWSSYKMGYENWQKELRTNVDTAMTLPVATSAERAKKMAAFQDVSNRIALAKQSLCRTPGLITWQHAINSLHQREEACGRIISAADTFGKKMQATTNYLKSEQMLAAAIAAALAASDGKVTEEAWGSQVATWQDADKAITKMTSAEPLFASVKTDAVEKVKLVETAWQDLIAAHTAKDKTKYGEAQASLVAAYTALTSMSTTSAEQLDKLTAPLQSAYSELFNSRV